MGALGLGGFHVGTEWTELLTPDAACDPTQRLQRKIGEGI